MRVIIGLIILILTVSVAGALAEGKGDAKAGKTLYDGKCKVCHGAKGEGNATLAKTLKVTIRDLASKEVQSKSDADLKKDTTGGIGKMQPAKGLSDKDVEDMLAFVRSLAKP